MASLTRVFITRYKVNEVILIRFRFGFLAPQQFADKTGTPRFASRSVTNRARIATLFSSAKSKYRGGKVCPARNPLEINLNDESSTVPHVLTLVKCRSTIVHSCKYSVKRGTKSDTLSENRSVIPGFK